MAISARGAMVLLIALAAVFAAQPSAFTNTAGAEDTPGPAVISFPQNGSAFYLDTGISFTSEVLNSSTFGESLDFVWDFGDGNTSMEITPVHSYTLEGNYTIVLTITYPDGNVTAASVTINVSHPPLPAIDIIAGLGQRSDFLTGQGIDFSAGGLLMGLTGPSLSYMWDFGDGTVLDGQAPTHSYSRPGTYNVTVTVTDGHTQSTDSMTVIIKARPPVAVQDSNAIFGWYALSVVIVAGIGLFLGGTELGLGLLAPFFVFLYSKIKRDQILDNYTRGQIHGYIMANPGEHYNSIKGALELNNGTLAYHLNRLETEQIVKSRLDGLFRRYYPASMKMPEPNGHALTEVQRSIMSKIKETPGISQRDIASLMKLSNATINYHLERLLKKGTVRRERAGMRNRCFLTPEGELEIDGHHGAPPQNS